MKTILEYDDVKEIWKQSQGGTKFEQNGKFGLKNASGETILEPIYDQIEQCLDYLYTRAGTITKKHYPFGQIRQETFDPEDPTFYENGKMGLKAKDGTIIYPAVFDCVEDWSPYEVIYVRNKEEFHYFNHQGEEVLTDWQPIESSHCDDKPFFIHEEQSTEVIVTRKFVKTRKNNNCIKFGERWVEFDRFPKKDLAKVMGECELIPMPEDAFDGINSLSTYIYDGFIASSRKENPVDDCINQLKSLSAYAASWRFITKVWIHPESDISMEEIKKFWLIYSCHSNFYHHNNIISRFSVEDWLRIGVGYDHNLAKDEVKVLQIHYFTDRWPAPIESEWVKGVRHLEVKEIECIKKRLDAYIQDMREQKGDDVADTIHREILEGCHISGNIHTELSTEKELAKYDYLKGLNFHCLDTLWYTCMSMMIAPALKQSENLEPLSETELNFITAKIGWLLRNGTALNYVKESFTALDMVTLTKELYEHLEFPIESQVLLSDLEILMRQKGCRYARKLGKEEIFWREFKPGLYDETPFKVKPYVQKVVIGEDTTMSEEMYNQFKNLL